MDHITEPPSSSKVLHLFGSEGTGKSSIAQTIAEYCKSNGTLGACFFFSRASSERNTDKNLIATLAYQLCVTVPEFKQFIVKAVEDDLSTFQKDLDTKRPHVWVRRPSPKIFMTLLRLPNLGHLFVFVRDVSRLVGEGQRSVWHTRVPGV